MIKTPTLLLQGNVTGLGITSAGIIYMYWFDRQKHTRPHFHARHGGEERLIVEWCQERRQAIVAAWEAAVAGKEIPWVPPLR